MSGQLKQAGSVVLWWAGFTLVLWWGGQLRHSPASLAACAASAALLVALGETAHSIRQYLRRRRNPRKTAG
ncbi:hypothetical protein [Streptomyces sp. NPDC101132]|uniref:hypothetical protein n=1 Tax=Streptomyces sp. NPDC101132 TaxID=3366110 RepID=UPI003827FC90